MYRDILASSEFLLFYCCLPPTPHRLSPESFTSTRQTSWTYARKLFFNTFNCVTPKKRKKRKKKKWVYPVFSQATAKTSVAKKRCRGQEKVKADELARISCDRWRVVTSYQSFVLIRGDKCSIFPYRGITESRNSKNHFRRTTESLGILIDVIINHGILYRIIWKSPFLFNIDLSIHSGKIDQGTYRTSICIIFITKYFFFCVINLLIYRSRGLETCKIESTRVLKIQWIVVWYWIIFVDKYDFVWRVG